MERPSESDLDLFVGLALASMLIELAASRGWLGIHAAGLAIGGRGILLPGASGAGKSTIFTHAHRAGHQVLSDDLVWVRMTQAGPRMQAFPRGKYGGPVPMPTTDDVELYAIVCPMIAAGPENRLSPLEVPELIEVLTGQSGFLSSGATAGERFRALVRLSRSLPGYRLEAGRQREEVPSLLMDLAAPRSARQGRETPVSSCAPLR